MVIPTPGYPTRTIRGIKKADCALCYGPIYYTDFEELGPLAGAWCITCTNWAARILYNYSRKGGTNVLRARSDR